MLKIYTDDNAESAIARGLKRRNIDALSVNEVNNLGLRDEKQLEYAELFDNEDAKKSDYFSIIRKLPDAECDQIITLPAYPAVVSPYKFPI